MRKRADVASTAEFRGGLAPCLLRRHRCPPPFSGFTHTSAKASNNRLPPAAGSVHHLGVPRHVSADRDAANQPDGRRHKVALQAELDGRDGELVHGQRSVGVATQRRRA